jgi:hypothetical protein
MAYSGNTSVHVLSGLGDPYQSGTSADAQVTIEDVALSGMRWIATETDDPGFYPTVSSQDISSGSILTNVLPASILEGIVFSLQSQVSINPNAGHIALTIVDTAGEPIPGVEVSFNSGGGTVAYRDGSSWFDVDDATSTDGQIFLINEQASDLPGQTSQLIFIGAVNEELAVRVVRGAVTVMTIQIP